MAAALEPAAGAGAANASLSTQFESAEALPLVVDGHPVPAAPPPLSASTSAARADSGDVHGQAHGSSEARPPIPPEALAHRVSPADFTLMRVIGRGAFGKVLQVAHKGSGRIYAMKVMDKAFLARVRIDHLLLFSNGSDVRRCYRFHPVLFADAFASHARPLRSACRIVVTGPWHPWSEIS